MNTTALTPHVRVDVAGIHTRPGFGRLLAVELRKMVDTRAGFWLQIAIMALTALVVTVRCATGDTGDHTFVAVLDVGLQPAAVLLPIVGVLLVTSEWTQRTGLITFALVPVRSRVLAAKLLSSIVLSLAMLAMSIATVAAGVALTSSGTPGTWSDTAPMIGQAAVFLTTGMIGGLAFGAILRESAPAIVILFALPIAWAAAGSLSFLSGAAAWLDTLRAVGPIHQEVLSTTQWARAATAIALWNLLPLLIGTWRVTRREVVA